MSKLNPTPREMLALYNLLHLAVGNINIFGIKADAPQLHALHGQVRKAILAGLGDKPGLVEDALAREQSKIDAVRDELDNVKEAGAHMARVLVDKPLTVPDDGENESATCEYPRKAGRQHGRDRKR